MHHQIMGPFWGNVLIIGICGLITISCFAAMFWFIFHPGEQDAQHPKHDILRPDR